MCAPRAPRACRAFRVVGMHALRNAHDPGGHARSACRSASCSPAPSCTESIFSWPGIGKWMVDSVFKRDYPVIQGGLLIIAGIVMLVNLDGRPALRPDQSAHQALREDPWQTYVRQRARRHHDSASIPSRRARFAEFWYLFLREPRCRRPACVSSSSSSCSAIFAPLIAPHAPQEQYRDAVLVPPFWQEGGRSAFLLGTDAVGRDILSRLIYGTRYSLFIGVIVTLYRADREAYRSASSPAISAAGSTRVIMRVMDIILAFPSLLLALVLVGRFWGPA